MEAGELILFRLLHRRIFQAASASGVLLLTLLSSMTAQVMNKERRNFFRRLGSIGTGLALSQKALANREEHPAQPVVHSQDPRTSAHQSLGDGQGPKATGAQSWQSLPPVECPDLAKLP